jgi:hypothetical protein
MALIVNPGEADAREWVRGAQQYLGNLAVQKTLNALKPVGPSHLLKCEIDEVPPVAVHQGKVTQDYT